MTALVLDTETHDVNGILIELAWFNPNTGESFEQRYNPACRIESGAMAVHHITDADVADKPLHTTVKLPDGVKYVIGHKVDYDLDVLARSGVDVSGIKTICTLALARKAYPDFKSHTIGALMYALSETQEKARDLLKNAHSAKADIDMTYFILGQIVKKLSLSHNPHFLFIASEDARIVKTMPFGKHKDKKISELDIEYIDWALGNLKDIDPYLHKALFNAQEAHKLANATDFTQGVTP